MLLPASMLDSSTQSEAATPHAMRRLSDARRQRLATVNARLVEQFHIEKGHASLFRGVCVRLDAGSTAHTLCIEEV